MLLLLVLKRKVNRNRTPITISTMKSSLPLSKLMINLDQCGRS
jgi:hypothetical protein